MTRIVIAVLLSFFFPGCGQYYNRDFKKGNIILVLTTLLFVLPSIWIVREIAPRLPNPTIEVVSPEKVQEIALDVVGRHRHVLNLISFSFLGIWAYAITQAYFKAKEQSEQEKEKDEDEES